MPWKGISIGIVVGVVLYILIVLGTPLAVGR